MEFKDCAHFLQKPANQNISSILDRAAPDSFASNFQGKSSGILGRLAE